MTRPRQGDDGFTLIEAVIAILVMSIAVVTMVGFLTTMITLSQNHRGHAAAETAARSFGQAVQATAQSPAALAAPVDDSETAFTVVDATTLPAAGANSYLMLDREIVRVSSIDRAARTLTVERAQGGTTASAHPVTATSVPKLVPLLRCPSAADLTPDPGSYRTSTGVTPVITSVEYVPNSATGAFSATSSGCLASYAVLCPGGTLLPECGTGLFRVSISVSTSGDSRLNQVAATTKVLVRTGSA